MAHPQVARPLGEPRTSESQGLEGPAQGRASVSHLPNGLGGHPASIPSGREGNEDRERVGLLVRYAGSGWCPHRGQPGPSVGWSWPRPQQVTSAGCHSPRRRRHRRAGTGQEVTAPHPACDAGAVSWGSARAVLRPPSQPRPPSGMSLPLPPRPPAACPGSSSQLCTSRVNFLRACTAPLTAAGSQYLAPEGG